MRVPCPQCGGEIRLQDTTGFVGCPYCGASLVWDLTGVRPHLLYRPPHGGTRLLPLLRRWGDADGLPSPSVVSVPQIVYYPFWRFPGRGRLPLAPAWATLEARWTDVQAPDAEQTVYDPAVVAGARMVEASVAEAAARARTLGEGASPPGDLVHLPFYEMAVRIGGHRVRVSLEACSGRVYPDRIPAEIGGARNRGAFSGWRAILAFLAMALEAMLIPAGWLAGVAVAVTAAAFYWAVIRES